MATPIFLPKIGMTMEEGTVARWLLPDGAAVTRGQPVFELETAKAIVEKFGQEPPKGSASYAIMRSFQMRISRVPRPQVARGDKDWKNAR